MALTKCPRCELNYILDGGALCSVCYEEVHGKKDKEYAAVLCSVCGERPALRGQEMCGACIKDLRSIEMDATGDEDEAGGSMDFDEHTLSDIEEMEALQSELSEDEDEEMEEEHFANVP